MGGAAAAAAGGDVTAEVEASQTEGRNYSSAWVTWPERPKGVKDEVKEAQRVAD